jgi:hypothetical protein
MRLNYEHINITIKFTCNVLDHMASSNAHEQHINVVTQFENINYHFFFVRVHCMAHHINLVGCTLILNNPWLSNLKVYCKQPIPISHIH